MFVVSAWSMQRTWKEVVAKDCQARILNRKDAVGRSRWRKLIENVLQDVLQCFDAVGWAAGRASGL